MKQQSVYKGHLDYQSNFDRKYACWANNHRGWTKMKKLNKRIAKKRLKADEPIVLMKDFAPSAYQYLYEEQFSQASGNTAHL